MSRAKRGRSDRLGRAGSRRGRPISSRRAAMVGTGSASSRLRRQAKQGQIPLPLILGPAVTLLGLTALGSMMSSSAPRSVAVAPRASSGARPVSGALVSDQQARRSARSETPAERTASAERAVPAPLAAPEPAADGSEASPEGSRLDSVLGPRHESGLRPLEREKPNPDLAPLEETPSREPAEALPEASGQPLALAPAEEAERAPQGPTDLPPAPPSLAAGYENERRALRDQVLRDSTRRTFKRLLALRQELEDAREHALDVIFDNDIFYKDAGGVVHGLDKVNEAVLAVRKLAKMRVDGLGANDRRRAKRLKRLETTLVVAAGERPTPERDDLWIEALSEGQRTLADIPLSLEEALELAQNRVVREANAERLAKFPPREAELVRRCNDHRTLLGKTALAFDARLHEAARMHSADMTRLNFFSHTSPVEGRESPQDRVRLSGYPLSAFVVGPPKEWHCSVPADQPRALDYGEGSICENIAALQSAAQGVFDLWYKSPGHHRNILAKIAKCIAAAATGTNWTGLFCNCAKFDEIIKQIKFMKGIDDLTCMDPTQLKDVLDFVLFDIPDLRPDADTLDEVADLMNDLLIVHTKLVDNVVRDLDHLRDILDELDKFEGLTDPADIQNLPNLSGLPQFQQVNSPADLADLQSTLFGP